MWQRFRKSVPFERRKRLGLWKFQISILLKFHDVYDFVTGKAEKPTNQSDSDFQKKLTAYEKNDVRAQRAISSTIEREALLHIVNCKTAAEMWTKLHSVYEKKSETSMDYLQQKFFVYSKEPEDNIATFISKLQEIAQQLVDMGETISDKMLMTRILMSLSPQYNSFKSAWESTEASKRTLNELCTRLMIEESRLTEVKSSASASFWASEQIFVKNRNDKVTNGHTVKSSAVFAIAVEKTHTINDSVQRMQYPTGVKVMH